MTRNWSKEAGRAVFAFRGFNVTNLGRSPELLDHPAYGSIVEKHLRAGSEIASELVGRSVDLVQRVKSEEETDLDAYADAIALILVMELAQLEILREFFGGEYTDAEFACGYSLGEIASLVAGGVYDLEAALRIPLSMADDCVALARNVRLGVLFSRGEPFDMKMIERLLVTINLAGDGMIGISAFLSPNTLLLMGSGSTIDMLNERRSTIPVRGVHLRVNESRWPPLHTPLVACRNIADRSACMLMTLPGGMEEPTVPILSMVTGQFSYTDYNSRDLVTRWIDHPQRLWDVVCETLNRDVSTVVHVGPQPNIIPSTYKRLAGNVEAQLQSRRRMRALSAAARSPWLKTILPKRAALLRAPYLRHIILEDWLLENSPS